MSSKFSRRSTRVQRKPHVCISEPQPWPAPFVPPAGLYLILGWDFEYSEFSPRSIVSIAATMTQIFPTTWAYETVDSSGSTVRIQVHLVEGDPVLGQFGLAAIDPFNWFSEDTAETFTGSPGFATTVQSIPLPSGYIGSGSWQVFFT